MTNDDDAALVARAQKLAAWLRQMDDCSGDAQLLTDLAAALRAAADWREALEAEVAGDVEATRDQLLSAVDAGANQADIQRLNRAVWKLFDRAHALRLTFRRIDALTVTLAAREALLRRAGEALDAALFVNEGGQLERARALAAEIAAALKEKNDG